MDPTPGDHPVSAIKNRQKTRSRRESRPALVQDSSYQKSPTVGIPCDKEPHFLSPSHSKARPSRPMEVSSSSPPCRQPARRSSTPFLRARTQGTGRAPIQAGWKRGPPASRLRLPTPRMTVRKHLPVHHQVMGLHPAGGATAVIPALS